MPRSPAHPPVPTGCSRPSRQLLLAGDSTRDYESGGQEFESLRARQYVIDFDSEFLRDFRPLTVGLFGAAPGQHPRIFTVIAARLNPLILVCEESPIVGGELFGNCRSARRLSSLRARKPTHHLLDCRLFFLRHPAAFD